MDENTDPESNNVELSGEFMKPPEVEEIYTKATLKDPLEYEHLGIGHLQTERNYSTEKERTDDKLLRKLKKAPSGVPYSQEKFVVINIPESKEEILGRRQTISLEDYNVPRYGGDDYDEGPRTSGDFGVKDTGAAAPIIPVKFYKYMDDDSDAEEKEEIKFKEEVKSAPVDRAVYYEKHIMLTQLLKDEHLENDILNKKLSIFFKKKKMGTVLKETDPKVDDQQKYDKKLDAYAELLEIDSRQRKTEFEDLENLKEERKQKSHQLQKQFEELQEREKEVGIGLINFNTGNRIPNKVVQRLIRLQKSEMEKLIDMRLKLIKLKHLVDEKEEAVEICTKIGEDLYLKDFEELKLQNRNFGDKIEERNEELTKLRNKCQNTIQILAHTREKTAALDSDIDDLKVKLSAVKTNSIRVRERLNSLKQKRDYYRKLSNKLRSESGLLTEEDLLRDMEESMRDLQVLTGHLENRQAENNLKAKSITNIRKHIEFVTEDKARSIYTNLPEKLPTSTHPPLHKWGRPSIFTPTLPKDAFDHLKDFKSKSTFGNSKRRSITHNRANRFL